MKGYDELVKRILRREGGYSNRKADRGGPTNMGVTQRTYDAWLASKGLPPRDVRLLTYDEAWEIYRYEYWRPAQCDALPDDVRDIHFDAAVNHGIRRAAKLLQEAAGVKQDGDIGPITLAAVAGADPEKLRLRYTNARYRFYGDIIERDKTQLENISGWMNRMEEFA